MPDLWMPGAEKLPVGNTAPLDGGPAKAIPHITWDKNATAAQPADLVPYENLRDYFSKNASGRAVAPHVLWDPFTGKVAQFFPANSRSLSLADGAGGTRTNRAGAVVIQVEALFFPYCRVGGKVYAKLTDTPCKGWPELYAWIKSHGVPDVWPMGKPVNFNSNRSEATWEAKAGWYGHSQVPENSHQDPGSWPSFPAAPKPPATGGGGATKPKYEPYPGASWFSMGRKSPIVAAMHNRLVAVGCNKYTSTANKDTIGSGDKNSYEAYMRKLGLAGADAKWPPGPWSWGKLQVPNV